jgi:hypothetical protein
MKTLCLILLSFLLSFSAFSQEFDDLYHNSQNNGINSKINLKELPKGTWRLDIKTNKIKEDNYKFIGETLILDNYQIDKANKDFYVISTVAKSHDRLNFDYILNFVARDSLIILTGTYKVNVTIDLGSIESDFGYDKINNIGQNGSPAREAFRMMFEFALSLADKSQIEFITN